MPFQHTVYFTDLESSLCLLHSSVAILHRCVYVMVGWGRGSEPLYFIMIVNLFSFFVTIAMWARWWFFFFLELLFIITQFKTGTGVSPSLQSFFHSSIGLLVRSYKYCSYIELPSHMLIGVIALTLILNIFRVRKIGLKSVFVMVCNNSW